MPVFDTPEPISVTLEFGVGQVRITASDRTDTTVDVRPTDPSDESDVQAAQRIRVAHANGALQVTGPKSPMFDFSRRTRSVDVSIDLPAGSHVSVETQMGDVDSTGRLGECRFVTSVGNVRVDRTGPLRVRTGGGHVTVNGVAGHADVHTGAGKVRIVEVEGSVDVKNSNGHTEIDTATDDVRVRAANGDITVGRAGADVEAKTANGSVRLGEVARGSVEVGTSTGDLEIGIADGTAARLDVKTGFGQVHNLLDDVARPEKSDETVEVRAQTSFGAITVRRS